MLQPLSGGRAGAAQGTQGAHIIAIDFTRQVVVAAVGDQPPKVYHFDRKTLTVAR